MPNIKNEKECFEALEKTVYDLLHEMHKSPSDQKITNSSKNTVNNTMSQEGAEKGFGTIEQPWTEHEGATNADYLNAIFKPTKDLYEQAKTPEEKRGILMQMWVIASAIVYAPINAGKFTINATVASAQESAGALKDCLNYIIQTPVSMSKAYKDRSNKMEKMTLSGKALNATMAGAIGAIMGGIITTGMTAGISVTSIATLSPGLLIGAATFAQHAIPLGIATGAAVGVACNKQIISSIFAGADLVNRIAEAPGRVKEAGKKRVNSFKEKVFSKKVDTPASQRQ